MKEIDTTRWGVPSNPSPLQPVIAVVAFQFGVAPPRKVFFSSQRALQSAMSPVFV